MTRRVVSSGGHWEGRGGYSRAIVVGDTCWVAGTTDAGPDGHARHPGDVAAQARGAIETIEGVLSQVGFALGDIVVTRIYVTDMAEAAEPILAVHGRVFGHVRPAATMVEVTRLIDPTLLVEIEAVARKG